jgi:glycosyltransferase involved in cell wall biosynthesis
MHDFPLWIAGTGPEEARLKQLAQELGASHVRFLGFVAPRELAKIRTASEVTLLATRMRENASGALLESLAAGIPVIASDVGGNPELVQEGETGWLAPADDVEAWREALHRCKALLPERRAEMGARGRAFIERGRTWKAHQQALDEIYAQVMSG